MPSRHPYTRVLVTGASGNTGSRLASRLAARGVAVTAANRAGIGPAGTTGTRFDWYDAGTHPGALFGADRMYLVPPSRDADPQAAMLPFLGRARAAGVRRVVLLSSSVVPAGPETLSYGDVAAILTEASGRTIIHVDVDPVELRVAYEAAGLPLTAAQFLVDLDTAIASGIENRTTDTVERMTGVAPRSFREFAVAEFGTRAVRSDGDRQGTG